jgi:hypothetical protein
MSKESKPRDLWRHVFAAAADRPDTWCKGCGYYHVIHSEHRADCTIVKTAQVGRKTRCGCGARLIRPESILARRCLECRLIGAMPDDTGHDTTTSAISVATSHPVA